MGLTIGFDGHVLTGRFQGTRTTVTNLLRALSSRLGPDRLIVYSDNPDEARAHLNIEGFEYQSLGYAGRIKRLLWVFPRHFQRDGVDVGIFQYMTPMTGKNVVFIHDLLPLSHPHLFPWSVRVRTRIFFSLAIWRAVKVLAVSEFTRAEIQRLYKLPADKVAVIRNGPSFDESVYSPPRTANESDRYILIVGRIEPRKNVPLLVDALLAANIQGIRLIVVGSFDLDFNYQVPPEAPVEIRSGVSDQELIELYRGASLFVYPTQAEGFGVPLLDAILFGLPVISSNQTSLPEVGVDLVHYFDPTAPAAVNTLAAMLVDHFGGKPLAAPTEKQRLTHGQTFSWASAAIKFREAIACIKE